jgi:D-aspartate ligase
MHAAGVGVARSLGRVGVPVYAITEDPHTPLARSRYLTDRFVAPTSGLEDPETLVDLLAEVAERLPDPTIVVPTDDEAAVLVAEHRDALDPRLATPAVPCTLPRRLASKRGLYEECVRFGVPSPYTVFCDSPDMLETIAGDMEFPVVAKNTEPWVRVRAPVVHGTTVIESPAELLALREHWSTGASVLVQEYIPMRVGTDWILHAYSGAEPAAEVAFTGVKYRSWPPQRGVTTYGRLTMNEELLEIGTRFFRDVGYRGISDLDWRFDVRDGKYKLVDFNPRLGGQFRLFETDSGLDVVRAMHLDLTGREIPHDPAREGRGYVLEHFDFAARITYKQRGLDIPDHTRRAVEHAWFARDDLLPFVAMAIRAPSMLVGRLRSLYDRLRAAIASATRGAAKWVPATKRSRGPKVSAAGRPVK